LHCRTAGFHLATDRLFGPLKQQFGVQEVEMAVREWLRTQGHFSAVGKVFKHMSKLDKCVSVIFILKSIDIAVE
jgi:hypothetical protein